MFFSKKKEKTKPQLCIPFVQRDESVGEDIQPDFNLKHLYSCIKYSVLIGDHPALPILVWLHLEYCVHSWAPQCAMGWPWLDDSLSHCRWIGERKYNKRFMIRVEAREISLMKCHHGQKGLKLEILIYY